MRILIVEDEVKMAGLLRRGLRAEGLAADVAARGEDALWMAGSTEYDAIVLDVMLPGIDGFEVCRRLRDDGVWAPVLMLTARDGVDDRVAGLDGGADDYLTKPFSYSELARPPAGAGPARRGRAPGPARRSATYASIRPLGASGAASPRSSSRRRSSRSSRPSCVGPARCSPVFSCSSTPGTTSTRTARTSSTRSSACSGGRSISRSAHIRSRPFAGPAIGCGRTAEA